MKTIRIHRDDLVEILEMVDDLNPAGAPKLGAGYVEITEGGSSGLGAVLSAAVGVEIDGYFGTFTKTIIDEEAW